MEFAPLSTNSPSKHPLNGTSRPELQFSSCIIRGLTRPFCSLLLLNAAMTSVQQFDVEGGHGGDTMTPSLGRRVDIQGESTICKLDGC